MRPESRREPSRNLFIVTGLLRGAIYLILGFYIFFSKSLLSYLSPILKMIFAAAIVAYGIFRIYRLFIVHKLEDENETEI